MSERREEMLGLARDCVHCGLCLTSCPTYRETGREQSSPRGRIYLYRGVAEGAIALDEVVAEEAQLCLGCRACETACPSGVEYGRLLELARAEAVAEGLRDAAPARIERFALRHLVPHRGRLRTFITALGLVQRLGLDRIAAAVLPARLRTLVESAPRVPHASARAPLPSRLPAQGERRGTVGLLVGCVMPELFGDVNAATARVLARNGFEVVVSPAQGCCGALHAHAGETQAAAELARANVAAFAGVDLVVTNSAGCGAAMRDAGHWLPGEGEALASRVRDVSEVLVEAGVRTPPERGSLRVCYDDPCHLVHGQKVSVAPRKLLESIPGVTLVPHADASACCGAAGTYNLTQPEMSRAVLARKLDALEAADPDVIATGNPGCLMQLQSGAREWGLRARVVHPVTLLDEAYG